MRKVRKITSKQKTIFTMTELNRRETHRASIERIMKFTKSDEFNGASLCTLRVKKEMLSQSYEKFVDEHLAVVEANVRAEDMGTQNNALEATESMYVEALANFIMRIETLELEQNRASASQNHDATNIDRTARSVGHAHSDVRLERITPTIFSGDYAQWSEWKGMFESLVHKNPTLDDAQKFHYLKKALDGAAARVISGWNAVGENYSAAYDALKEIYENKYRLIMAHLDELVSMPKLVLETHDGLRAMNDTTKRVLRQLQVLEVPTDSWDPIIIHFILTRLPPRTLTQWETTNDLQDMPTLEVVTKFLDRRARGIVNLAAAQANNMLNQNETVTGAKPKVTRTQVNKQGAREERGISCHNCKQPHPMYRCAKFIALPLEQRRARVRELQLCANCFMPNHRAGSPRCKFDACKRCRKGEHHNVLLCSVQLPQQVTVALARHENSDANEDQQMSDEQSETNFQ